MTGTFSRLACQKHTKRVGSQCDRKKFLLVTSFVFAISGEAFAEYDLSVEEEIDIQMGILINVADKSQNSLMPPLFEWGHTGPQPFDQEPPLAQADLSLPQTE